MDSHASETNNQKSTPEPEVLQPHGSKSVDKSGNSVPIRRRLRVYRPSHKATFIGIGVVVVILSLNVAVIWFVIKSQTQTKNNLDKSSVTLSTDTLDKLGVNRDSVGGTGTELVVGPNSRFNGNVTVGNDISVAGQLKLNGTFSAQNASLAKLQAGDTALNSLNVNGDGTISSLSLRSNLAVAGTTQLQGPVTIGQLLTVNNNLNVAGNVAVGGTLSTRSFEALTITADNGLVTGGHVITRGSAPGVGPGGAVGNNGTVSISGNDQAGTVAVNIGTNGGVGMLAQVSFRSSYSSTPHVVVTPVGLQVPGLYVTRTAYGFTIATGSPLSPGGYAFDYIIMQ